MSKRLSFSIAVDLLTENFKKGANAVKNSLRSMQMQVITFAAALGAGGLGLTGLITRFREVARETSRVTTALKNVSGGTKGFADNLRFINDLANKYGLEINALTGNFAKFTASATQANMPMEQQKKVFESVSRAITAFGLSASESDGVMLALSQMMSKGKISMEELRKQMGEKLPVAMQAMAKALGVSIGEMEKLIGSGKVMSADILPKFADALNDIIPNVDTDNLETSLSRLSNMFSKLVDTSGFTNKYKALIDGLTTLVQVAGENIKTIVQGVIAVILGLIAQSSSKTLKTMWGMTDLVSANIKELTAVYQREGAQVVALEKQIQAKRQQFIEATGNTQKRIYAELVALQKERLSAVASQQKTQLAMEAANAQKVPGLWNRAYGMIKLGAIQLGLTLKSLWSSFSPMIIVTAITMIGQKIYELATATTKAEDAMVDFNSEAIKESKNLNSLFDAYRKANDGTKEKDRLLNLIKSKYGEYIKNLIDEKGRIIDLDKAQRQSNEALRQSIALKVKNSAVGNVQEEGIKKQAGLLGDIRKIVTKSKGEDAANRSMEAISKLINDTNSSPRDLAEKMKSILAKEGVGKRETSSLFGGDIESKTALLAKVTDNIKKETKDIENSFKGLIGDFKEVSDISGNDMGSTTISDISKEIEQAKNNVKSLKEEIKELRSGKKESTNYASDIESKAKELADAEAKLAALTGKDNKALRGAEKRLEALRKLDEDDRKRQIEKQKFDLDMQQKAIDIMDDSFEKRTKQTLLNLEKEKLSIEEFQSDLLKQQTEYLKTKYASVKGTDKGFGEYFKQVQANNFKDVNGVSILPEGLRTEDIEKQVGELLSAAQNAQAKGLKDINRDLSMMLKEQELMFASDLDKKLAELDAYYNEQQKKAKNNVALLAQLESNKKREVQTVKTDDKLKKLDFEEQLKLERVAGMESIGMTELVEEKKLEITKMYIQKRINALDVLASMGNQEAYKEMDMLKASLDKLDTQKPVKSLKSLADKAIFDRIKNGFMKAGDSAEEAEKKTAKLLSSISTKASFIANIASELQSMFGDLDESLDMALETVGNIAQGFASGGIVGGAMSVIGEGMKLFSKASEAAARHQKALKEIEESRLASQRAYNLLLLEQNLLLKEAVSVFGEKQITRATNAIQNYRDSLSDLKNEMQGDFAPDEAYKKYLEKGASSGGIMKAYFGKQLQDYQKQVDNYNKGIAALGEAKIVTGHKKTGLFGWGKGKDTYSAILDVDRYKKLIKENGDLDKEMLQTIITTEKMDDSTKTYLQNILALYNQAEAAQEELRNYLQSTFGSLGDDIMTSLENAIKDKGISAWEAFGEAGAKVIEQLGKQIAYELFFADKFKKLQSDLEGVYGSGKDEEAIARESMDLVGKFYQNIGKDMELAQGFMENWQKEAEKYGLELWKPDKSSTQDSTKGYSVSMDQDTGGAILGRITGIHESILALTSMVSGITMDTSKSLTFTISINDELKKHTEIFHEMRDIQSKTLIISKEMKESLVTLGDIKSDLASINKNTKGLAPR